MAINEIKKVPMKSFENLLINFGISTKSSIKEFHPRVRDSEEIKVLKCEQSGVLFLDNIAQGSEDTYKNMDDFSYYNKEWSPQKENNPIIFEDDHRRKADFVHLIKGKDWVDFGCGSGGLLRLAHTEAKSAAGIELQTGFRNSLNEMGINCVGDINDIEDDSCDIITLFHVYEHLDEPVAILKALKSKLRKSGVIVIEVPQAKDILISFDPFKDFVFWSEHLILHTKESLKEFVKHSGFKAQKIEGYQRYPLSNHLHWVFKSKPGGHEKWSFLNNKIIEKVYSRFLRMTDKTDTLIAYLSKDS
jgi:2-polyprenyl-3-methyl-5-hydroxy-6-metoxy-1,4-benzoquinol methylase